MKSKLVYIIGGSMLAGSLVFGGNVYAAQRGSAPVLFGSVTEVDGTHITVVGRSGLGRAGKKAETITYAIDASNAHITEGYGKGSQEISAASLTVGDQVAVIATRAV